MYKSPVTGCSCRVLGLDMLRYGDGGGGQKFSCMSCGFGAGVILFVRLGGHVAVVCSRES